MFDLNAVKFLNTIRNIQRIKTTIQNYAGTQYLKNIIPNDLRKNLVPNFEQLTDATIAVGGNLASVAAKRMADALKDPDFPITNAMILHAIDDVESRLNDELSNVKFIILGPQQVAQLQKPANAQVGWDLSGAFPNGAVELEQATRCLALMQSTAAVFHAMRLLEIGIKEFSKLVGVEEPDRPSNKSWHTMLNEIKKKIDQEHPPRTRTAGSKGASLERIYVTLEAVRNPWRNGTMHVDNNYDQAEASFIIQCVSAFMKEIAKLSDPERVYGPAELPFEDSPVLDDETLDALDEIISQTSRNDH